MFYLRYLCLFAYSGVQHLLCCVLVLVVFVLYVASFSGLSIFDSVFSNVYFIYFFVYFLCIAHSIDEIVMVVIVWFLNLHLHVSQMQSVLITTVVES